METPELLRNGSSTVTADAAWHSVRIALGESREFFVVIAMQLAVSAAICGVAGRTPIVGLADSYLAFVAAFAVLGLVAFAIELFRRRMGAALGTPTGLAYRSAWLSIREEFFAVDYLLPAAIAFALAPVAMAAFTAAKQAIPFVHPFTWDARLGTLPDPISGGRPLWLLLQPLLGRPAITAGLDYFYNRVCTTLLLAPVVWASLLPTSPLRRRCLVAYVLLFLVVGNVLALVFASAGPAFFGRVLPGHANPYAALMNYLHSVDASRPLLAVRGQEGLWTAFSRGETVFGWGISAMPSVHVASVALAALFGFQLSKPVGIVLTIAAVCAFIASVALGWHYAVDGYAGAALACLIWWLAGRLTRRGAAVE